jgi:hypothetical protein
MKKWMMLLAGWMVAYGVVHLLPLVTKLTVPRYVDMTLCIIAIVTGVLVFIDK